MSAVVQGDALHNHSFSSRGINKSLILWYSNCRSVKNKVIDLRFTAASLPTNSIFLLTETWLDPGGLHRELLDPALRAVFRIDRRSRGGGVLIATLASTTPRAHVLRRSSWNFTCNVELFS